MLSLRSLVVAGLFGLIIIPPTFAKDIRNSQDHELVSRYPGSEIISYEEIEYASYTLPFSAPYRVSGRDYAADTTREINGRVTRIVYQTPDDNGNNQVYENYKTALERPGFSLERTCVSTRCGAPAKTYARFLGQRGVSFHDKAEAHFTIASYAKDGHSPVYVVVLNGRTNSPANHILVDVIETKDLELGKVVTNADALLQSLLNTGRAQIYDIYFDTGRSDIKSESENALTAIAQVLNKRNDLNLYVVGHTDDTGSLSTNTRLSDERAKAIVNNLTKTHNISADRLHPAGVGPFSPVASNETDEGRAKNRRVELVKRLQ